MARPAPILGHILRGAAMRLHWTDETAEAAWALIALFLIGGGLGILVRLLSDGQW